MDLPYFPINDFGPAMKGMVIGGIGILHVFLAQFAIGGGLLMLYFKRLAANGRSPVADRFVVNYFRVLVLVSFVLGAMTGVGMWFTTIQVSPRTIGMMVTEFHWIWAIEWTFFCLEVTAGYAYYRYQSQLSYPQQIRLLGLYCIGGWFSLFWVNGILSWQLTPGRWLTSHNIWDGFFNPSFWPSLVFRTIACLALAALAAAVVINAMDDLEREQREQLLHHAARLLSPMVAMPAVAFWYFASMPKDSREWVLGGSPP